MSQQMPPGWYPDPSRPGTQRWWDGTEWGAEAVPLPPGEPAVTHAKQAQGAHSGPGLTSPSPVQLEIKETVPRLVGMVALVGMMTFVSAWVVGVVGVLFFGVATALLLVRIFNPATLVADEHGVREVAWPRKPRTILWSEVSRFEVVDVMSEQAVCIHLSPSGMHHRRGLEAAAMGRGDVALLSSYLVPADRLADQLEHLRLRHSADL